jgi:uncharacterized protein YndB with AHSA1/START domain
MKSSITAEISIIIAADRKAVWGALTKPELVKEYFFGTTLSTTWEPGSPIIFSGEWQGKEYQDKGRCWRTQTMKCCNILTGAA